MWNKIRQTFAQQIFHSAAISHCEAIFHSPKANFIEKDKVKWLYPFLAMEYGKDEFAFLTDRFVRLETVFMKYFADAKCEIIHCRELWNISLCSMWNKIRLLTFAQQIFHSEAISYCEAIFHSPKANFIEKSTLKRAFFRWRRRGSPDLLLQRSARTQAPKQSTGLFLLLRNCPFRSSSE